MPQIDVGEETLRRLRDQARGEGFSDLSGYLDALSLEPDGFEMTPEIEDALEKGLADIRAGRVVSEAVVREDIERMRREWPRKGVEDRLQPTGAA